MASAKKNVNTQPTGSAMLEALGASTELVQAMEQVEQVEKPKRNVGIGTYVKEMILTTNWTNKEILESVHQKFEGCKTTYACIAWYRTHLRGLGQIGPRHAKKETTQEATV